MIYDWGTEMLGVHCFLLRGAAIGLAELLVLSCCCYIYCYKK
jgi:hypothetical protein